MKTPIQLNELQQLLESVQQPIVELKKISLPTTSGQAGYTSVVNRAQMVDLSQDLMPRFGVDRIHTQDLMELPGESAPSGSSTGDLPVFKPINDFMNQVRFVGQGWAASHNTSGIRCQTGTQNDYVEISFYGTGLNLLGLPGGFRNYTYSVDGNTESSNFIIGTPITPTGTGYQQWNSIVTVVTGLLLGIHTVKIKLNDTNYIGLQGFEVLNEYYMQVTGTTSNTSTTVSSVSVLSPSGSSLSNIIAGTTITGSGIPVGTTVVSVNATAGTMVISQAATASATVTLSFSGAMNIPTGSIFNGGKKYTSPISTATYNSGFDVGSDAYSAALGGRVLVYQNSDGSIGKRLRSVYSSPVFYPNVNHVTANEEVIRTHYWREFGNAYATTDFSTLYLNGTHKLCYYTLDDNATSLYGDDLYLVQSGYPAPGDIDGLATWSSSNYVSFSFVGTGVDVEWLDSASTSRSITIYIDGVSVASGFNLGTNNIRRITKLASGLPYGTHTVKLYVVTSGLHPVLGFRVYGPKKPSLPTGAVELAEYYLPASYLANITGGQETTSRGVIRKSVTREVLLTGTWTISNGSTQMLGSYTASANSSGHYIEIPFYGTGFELRGYAQTDEVENAPVLVDTVALNSSYPNAANITCSTYGNWGFGGKTINTSYLLSTVSSNVLVQNGTNVNGAGFTVNGLPLGWHKVRVTNSTTTAKYMNFNAFDVITPIYCPRNNGPVTTGCTLAVGNSAFNDLRKFSPTVLPMPKNQSRLNVGINGLTNTQNMNLAIADTIMPIYMDTDGDVEIAYSGTHTLSSTSYNQYVSVFVNGEVKNGIIRGTVSSAGIALPTALNKKFWLPKGYHLIYITASNASGTLGADSTSRSISVRKL